MTGNDIAQLAYLGLLGAVIAGWFFVQNRANLGKIAQIAAVWGLIFVGTIAAIGLWHDIRQRTTISQNYDLKTATIRVPVSRDGHYYLTLEINGKAVRFSVDTGASQIVLTKKDARRVGLDPATLDYINTAYTANGSVKSAPVRLRSVILGPVRDQNVRASVNAGKMQDSLLGMSYLRRFRTLSIKAGVLELQR